MSTATATNNEIRDLELQLKSIERDIEMSFERDDHVSLLLRLTTDSSRCDVEERAAAIYACIAQHVAAGGRVVFTMPNEPPRTLKVRLRKAPR